MPTTVIAQAGQTLCELAIAAGFIDCDPIRNFADNAGKKFLNEPTLSEGDRVVIPDVEPPPFDKGVEQTHKFEKKNAPAFLVRFVHGSPDKPYRQDSTSTFLNVSNYITNKGGASGNDSFPTATVFDQRGHADADAFKIEVVDPGGPGTVDVKLEALKPIFDAAGKVTGHEKFSGAEEGKRSLKVTAKQVASKVCYRSPYLRLVVDDEDKAALPNQTLLVSDMADGNNADNDKIEILDQLVRVSYERTKCPRSPKCTATAEVPISPNKQKIKLCVHGVRANVGDGATAIGGVTEQNIRRRTMKWFRRLYAQAHLAPQFVAPEVEFVDPPPDNMIVIGERNGANASGVTGLGTPSSLTFTLGTSPPRGPADPPDPVVTVNITGTAPLTPEKVGNLISGALPAGFKAAVDVNCRATNAANGSCDILITRDDGKRVMITGESTNDTGLLAGNAFAVCRVNLNQVDIDVPFAALLCSNMQVRRVLRNPPGKDGRLDFYVVGGLFGLNSAGAFAPAARGLAQIPAFSVPAAFQPKEPMRFASLMGSSAARGPTMDGLDHDPYSYPHEAGHVLHDGFHTQPNTPLGKTEMMTGEGTSAASAVGSSKRICDVPLKIVYQMYDPSPTVQNATPGKDTTQSVNATPRMLTNGQSVFGAF